MSVYRHPQFSRRIAVQAGAVGLLGLGMNHHKSLQAADVKAFNSLPVSYTHLTLPTNREV